MIKAAIGRHLANLCDVYATPRVTLSNAPGRLTLIGARDSPSHPRPAARFSSHRNTGSIDRMRQRMRQAHRQDAYQSFPHAAVRSLYRSMDSCSNYLT
jgi:hypothetical protein